MAHGFLCTCKKCTGGGFLSRSNKSASSKKKSAQRVANQKARGSKSFGSSKTHHDTTKGNRGNGGGKQR